MEVDVMLWVCLTVTGNNLPLVEQEPGKLGRSRLQEKCSNCSVSWPEEAQKYEKCLCKRGMYCLWGNLDRTKSSFKLFPPFFTYLEYPGALQLLCEVVVGAGTWDFSGYANTIFKSLTEIQSFGVWTHQLRGMFLISKWMRVVLMIGLERQILTTTYFNVTLNKGLKNVIYCVSKHSCQGTYLLDCWWKGRSEGMWTHSKVILFTHFKYMIANNFAFCSLCPSGSCAQTRGKEIPARLKQNLTYVLAWAEGQDSNWGWEDRAFCLWKNGAFPVAACCPGPVTVVWNTAAVLSGNFGGASGQLQFPWCCTGAPLHQGWRLCLRDHQLCCVMGDAAWWERDNGRQGRQATISKKYSSHLSICI